MNNIWHQLIDSQLPYPFDKDLTPMQLEGFYSSIFGNEDYLIPYYKEFLKNELFLVGLTEFIDTLSFLHNKPSVLTPSTGLVSLKESLKNNARFSKVTYHNHIVEYFKSCHPHITPIRAAISLKQKEDFIAFLDRGKND